MIADMGLKPARIGRYRPLGFFQIEGMPTDHIVDAQGNRVKGPLYKKIMRGAHEAGECRCPIEPCYWMKTKG